MAVLGDFKATTIDGDEKSLSDYDGDVVLVVNTASRCGFTPQFAGLEELHRTYQEGGLRVLGFPCNQFGGQEPGTSEEIAEFCSATYGVTFPMTEKVDVNGPDRHEIYTALVDTPDGSGRTGDIQWNFEKFLLGADGEIVARFDPTVEPEDPALVAAVEGQLD